LAKIAVALNGVLARRRREGAPGTTTPRMMARGDGWSVADVLCTCGPQDHPFEEQHVRHTVAVVLAGSFQYRSTAGHGLMTPGSLMLGNQGDSFECGHQHGEGDRCVSFWYDADYFERLAAEAAGRGRVAFTVPRLPPLRHLSPLVARTGAGVVAESDWPWEEIAMNVGVGTLRLATGVITAERLATERPGACEPCRARHRWPSALETFTRNIGTRRRSQPLSLPSDLRVSDRAHAPSVRAPRPLAGRRDAIDH
jgi:hypothetical protein